MAEQQKDMFLGWQPAGPRGKRRTEPDLTVEVWEKNRELGRKLRERTREILRKCTDKHGVVHSHLSPRALEVNKKERGE